MYMKESYDIYMQSVVADVNANLLIMRLLLHQKDGSLRKFDYIIISFFSSFDSFVRSFFVFCFLFFFLLFWKLASLFYNIIFCNVIAMK